MRYRDKKLGRAAYERHYENMIILGIPAFSKISHSSLHPFIQIKGNRLYSLFKYFWGDNMNS